MKNSFLFNFRNTLNNLLSKQILVIALLLGISSQLDLLHAQAKLSIQGILKKASGEAVPDGTYNLIFNLYTVENLGTPLWTETQMGVDVISGIYSTVLGNTTPLTAAFDVDYYLGVKVGTQQSTEMLPRIQLTSAPYALAIRGENNKFPSSGQVITDSLEVNGNVLTQNGAPGPNGLNTTGYGFLADRDSGLFSTGSGQVSLYSNNVKMLTATPDSVAIRSDLRLKNNANVNYNGLDDWRLVDTDYFEGAMNYDGWKEFAKTSENIGWNTGGMGTDPYYFSVPNGMEGVHIRPLNNNSVLKKPFNLASVGTYNYIKVKFNYYYLDRWQGDEGTDKSFAAIAKDVNGTGMVIGYMYEGKETEQYPEFGPNDSDGESNFGHVNDWTGANCCWSDFFDNAEMVFRKCDNCNDTFWLMFGAALTTTIKNYGVGMIEIWVK